MASSANEATGSRAVPRWLWGLVVGYFVIGFIGWAVLQSGAAWVAGNEVSAGRALFLTVNTLTLTGFETTIPLDQHSTLGLVTLAGLMVGGSIITLLVGALAIVRVTGLPISDRRITRFTLATYAAFVVAGGVALASGKLPLGASFFLSISAVGNVGLDAQSAHSASLTMAHAALLPLAFLGGLGMALVWDLLLRAMRPGHRLSSFSWPSLVALAAVYVIGTGLLTIVFRLSADLQWNDAFVHASAHALNARSAGFDLQPLQAVPRAVPWVLMALMVIGAGAGGAAGGVTVATVAVAVRGIKSALKGTALCADDRGRVFGIALLWIGCYMAIVAIAMVILLSTESQSFPDRLLLEVISATSNTGLSWGPISPTAAGSTVLTIAMLVGRVLAWVMLWKWAIVSFNGRSASPASA